MRALGIDYGRKRVGIAISDPAGNLAVPLRAVIINNQNELIEAIRKIVTDEAIDLIIIGNPIRDDGKLADLAGEISQIAERIRIEINVRIQLYDEYYSSATAMKKFQQAGLKTKKNKAAIDQLAAADILQCYLDSMKNV
jgi:putative Holliday junction resolvase